jgi:hypothetical protein
LTSKLLEFVYVSHFNWETICDGDGYINFLNSFSGHIAMQQWQRDRLCGETELTICGPATITIANGNTCRAAAFMNVSFAFALPRQLSMQAPWSSHVGEPPTSHSSTTSRWHPALAGPTPSAAVACCLAVVGSVTATACVRA